MGGRALWPFFRRTLLDDARDVATTDAQARKLDVQADCPPGPEHGRLTWKQVGMDGRIVRYGEAGHGPPVVFLHGWGLDHRVYARSLSQLAAAGVRVIAPALPGFGGTPGLAKERMTLAGYGEWVAGFLEAIRLTEPVLMTGHSFGGGVAIIAAHNHPDRVHGLVLINSIGGSAWTRHEGAVRSIVDRPLWDWGLHLPADLWPLRQIRRVIPVIVGEAAMNLARDPRSFWRTATLARSADLTPLLEELKRRGVPVVVLWGTRDQIITRASFETMCEALGAPDIVTVDAAHSWMIVEPETFGEVMTNVVKIAEMAAAAGPPRATTGALPSLDEEFVHKHRTR